MSNFENLIIAFRGNSDAVNQLLKKEDIIQDEDSKLNDIGVGKDG